MWRRGALACALLIGILAGRAGAQTPVILGFMESDTRLAVRRAVEIVLHEFLHTLGLGENPPTSRAITERVAVRCGD